MQRVPGIFTRDEVAQQFDGIKLKEFDYNNGARAVVSDFGARLVGLFHGKDESETNGVWNHPDTKRIVTDLDVDGRDILGGLRGWFGNETAFHLKTKDDEKKWETWHLPSVMDPGDYKVTKEDLTSITLVNKNNIKNVQLNLTFPFRTTRSFGRLGDPYSRITKSLRSVTYSGIRTGYELRVEKSLEGELVNPQMNPWTLNMLFAGTVDNPGTSISLTEKGASIVPYMEPDPIPKGAQSLLQRVSLTEDAIYYKTDNLADQEKRTIAYKIGVAPEDLRIVDGCSIGMKIVEVPDVDGNYQGTYELTITKVRKEDLPRDQDQIYDRAKLNLTGPKGSRQVYCGPIPGNDAVAFAEEEFQLGPLRSHRNCFVRNTVIDTMQYRGDLADIILLAESISGIKNLKQNLYKRK